MFGVEAGGLKELILGMLGISQKAENSIPEMTSRTGEATFQKYQDNLQGSQPSTDENLLPVGMVSGDLYSKAQLTVNDYSWGIENQSDHAGFIEYGTSKMVARAPLQDAMNSFEEDVQDDIDSTMESIVE